ncbi:hypothetical protein [Enterococcus sp. DIV0187]|uniref:hypothetical protein n=1 Tax=Enterococcus sp. DIV0187 TaxID=2774644 RepID=UPI003F210A15
MNRKKNLFLAAFLLGGGITCFPTFVKAVIYGSILFYLHIKFDFWEYEQRRGGGLDYEA